VAITTLSSREFNQDTARAKRAASKGPVFITDRGRPAHVLLSFVEYRRLAGNQESILEKLALPEGAEIDPDFEFPRLGGEFFAPVDFS
jgi:prevent-host-death family protein